MNDEEHGSLLVPLEDHEFQAISRMVYEKFGINLTDEKRMLVRGRLQRTLKSHQFSSFSEYIKHIKADKTEESLIELVNRISTNHTFFFREPEHFAFFRSTVLPEAISRHKSAGDHDLRIWSAGCSSGEEPYSIMIEMFEHFGHEYGTWNAGLLATDVSARALDIAKAGIYDSALLERVPKSYLGKYFSDNGDERIAVSDRIRKEVTFRHLNLMNANFPFKKKFDLIWCRNVMIYFDQPTRRALAERFAHWLVPGGYLFIGHSESLSREMDLFDYVQPAIYRKKG
jgi:chemotaxis protein methyltransferase CheR